MLKLNRLPVRYAALCAAAILWIGCGDDDGGAGPTVDAGPTPDGSQHLPLAKVERVFASEVFPTCLYASPLSVTSQGEDFVLAIVQDGRIVGLDPETGDTSWSYQLPTQTNEHIELLSTPAIVHDNRVVLGWQSRTDAGNVRTTHVVAVFDLETRELDPAFEPLELSAEVPTYDPTDGDAMVELDNQWQLMRAAIHHEDVPDSTLGLAYVSLGNGPSQQPFHGWVFELDLDAWQSGDADDAIASALVTTAENDCGAVGSGETMRCGGGVWNAAGPQFYEEEDGSYRILIPTGNGRVDYDVGAYAHSVMRVGRGLAFDRACDETACENFDELDPSSDCLDSCENIFTARNEPSAPPLMPEDGTCDGKTFLECYGLLDGDLGANAPAIVNMPDGKRLIVQAGKDGALYLVDGDHLGTMYQRMQVMDFCGTPDDACLAFWIGMFVTHPAVTYIDDTPVVILASVMADRTHASGITAVKVVMSDEGPRMEVMWQVPRFDSADAKKVFRHHPGRPIIYELDGEPYVFLVETRRANAGEYTAPPGILWGVRVRDGYASVQEPITNAGQRYAIPLVRDDMIYVNTCSARADVEGQVEAFRISEQ